MNHWSRYMRWDVKVWFVLAAMLIGGHKLYAQAKELDGTPIDDRVYKSFDSNWRKYARYAGDIGEGFAFIPTYQKRYESSRNILVGDAIEQLSEVKEVRTGNLVQKKVRRASQADAEAYVRALPDLKIGSYGWIVSAQIVEVINENQMIIQGLWLVDRDKLRAEYAKDEQESARRNNGEADKDQLYFLYQSRIKLMEAQEDDDAGYLDRFRLVGYDTRGLRPGDRWQGPNSAGLQVGVVRWETPEPKEGERRSSRDKPRLVLSEVEHAMRKNPDEKGFIELLAQAGMTVAEFVDFVRTIRDNDPANAEERILNSLMPPDKLKKD